MRSKFLWEGNQLERVGHAGLGLILRGEELDGKMEIEESKELCTGAGSPGKCEQRKKANCRANLMLRLPGKGGQTFKGVIRHWN